MWRMERKKGESETNSRIIALKEKEPAVEMTAMKTVSCSLIIPGRDPSRSAPQKYIPKMYEARVMMVIYDPNISSSPVL